MSSNRTPTALEAFFMLFVRSNGGPTLPQRPTANFLGFTISDDPDNNQTIIGGGGGAGSLANLTANFTQPAVDAVVVATVSLSSSYAVGADVAIFGGGFYDITAIPDSTHLTLKNLGSWVNAAPGATISSGALVIPSGPPNTRVQSNGADITQREILDLEGLTYTDDAGGNRMKFTFPAPTAPVVVVGSHTVQPGETWFEVPPGAAITMPVVPVVGLELVFTGVGTGFSAGAGGVSFAGNGHNLEDPQDRNNLSGSRPQAATVFGLQENKTWRFRYNGSLYRYVS